jgi:hypothetical protein
LAFKPFSPTFLILKFFHNGVDVILLLAEDTAHQPEVSVSRTEVVTVQLFEKFLLVFGLKHRRVFVHEHKISKRLFLWVLEKVTSLVAALVDNHALCLQTQPLALGATR